MIINYFSHKDTELVVFGDEKQNIYSRELDENKDIKITGIPGRWNKSLKESFRFKHDIGRLAFDFQKKYLGNKYAIDEMVIAQRELNFNKTIVGYYEENDIYKIRDFILNLIIDNNIHSNDVAILGDKISFL